MTIRRICTVCFRDLSDVLYYHTEYHMPIADIVRGTDIELYGRLCCIPHLVNIRETINLPEQKLKKQQKS